MSARWRIALATLAALLAVGLATLWFLRNFERVPEQINLPAYGEPTYNPLYALREALRRDGIKAESRRTLDLRAMQLQPGDTVLMLDDPRTLATAEAGQLLDWVQQGGHLLLRVPEADPELDRDTTLLGRLGVQPSDIPPRCQPWRVKGQDEHSEFCRGQRFTLATPARAELRWGDGRDATLAHARLRHGSGRVEVLSDMDFLRNGNDEGDTGLRDVPHRDLARLLLAPNYGHGTIHLVYAVQAPSLWRTLLHNAWPVWLPLLLALLAWLWMRSQRFGALLPSPREERRSLLEHVRASGEHLHRYGKTPLLHAAMRQAFFTRLRRRAPLAAALSGEAQARAIAEHLHLPPEQVRTALQAPASRDDAALRERIALLIRMRNQP